jgi:hypothetical protein
MFSSPTEHSITTGFDNGTPIKETVFSGPFTIGSYDEAPAQIGAGHGGAYLKITAKKKYGDHIKRLFATIQQTLKNNSLYRGKAVEVTLDGDRLNTEIIEVTPNDHIVLNHPTKLMVDRLVIPSISSGRKEIFMFYGSYGNGKTETGLAVGYIGMQKHATFFYVKSSQALIPLLSRVHVYTPAVIFMEDIDEIGSGEERNEEINNILNTLDGIALKGKDITLLFTSNHPENINKALKRPGRIDAMIAFGNPDENSRVEIIRRLCKLEPEQITKQYLEYLPENVSGAIIAEICNRAIRYSQSRLNEDASTPNCVTPDDFTLACSTIENQLKLMEEQRPEKTPELTLAFTSLLQSTVVTALQEATTEIVASIEENS